MNIVLIDGSNVIRHNTGPDAHERPYLMHGLLGVLKILSRQKASIEVYLDRGLMWKNLRQKDPPPTMSELCEQYNDKRSLHLFKQICQHPAVRIANDGRPADCVILDREEVLLQEGKDAVILSNDGYLKYTFCYPCLANPLYGAGSNILAPFSLANWTFSCPRLNISPTHFWRK